jgi:hypothetical protein
MSLQAETRIEQKPFPKVRTAVPEDFPQIMDMGVRLYDENGAINVNWKKVQEVVIDGINGNMATIGVIGSVGSIEGMIYLRISDLWYSGDTILEELFNYVLPQHRKSRNAHALVNFAKECSEKFQVPLLIGVISNKRTEEKVRLYKRILGPTQGAFFFYGVDRWSKNGRRK